MIIYNVKLNKKLILKVCLSIMATICICITIMSIYNLFFAKTSSMNLIDDSIPSSEPAEIISSNYTNILKQVHNNLDTYVGQKISFTGYVYRLKNFSSDQFVLARDMDIGNNQTLIVGFLCESQDIKNYQDQTWVKIEGEITKGYYNEDYIPIIKITKIENAEIPLNPNVPMPDDSYVPTAVIY